MTSKELREQGFRVFVYIPKNSTEVWSVSLVKGSNFHDSRI